MSQIIEFLKGTGTDTEGRTLDEILKWPDAKWEHSHDMIQWVFPLNEPSMFNADAPVLSDEEIEEIRNSPEALVGIRKAYDRYVKFLGNPQWITTRNHNFLRITRVLKCLNLVGLVNEHSVFKGAIGSLYHLHKDVIGETTYKFWSEA